MTGMVEGIAGLTDDQRAERADWHATEDIPNEGGQFDPFQAAIRRSRVPMILTDPRRPDNPIIFANQAFQALSGYAREEIVGRNCRFLQGPGTDREEVARMRAAIEAGEDVDVTLLNYRKDGSTFWNGLYVTCIKGADDEPFLFFASQLDMTEHHEMLRIIGEEVRRKTAQLTLAHREMHHRVKNNITTIEAMLRYEVRMAKAELRPALASVAGRIETLGAVQRLLDEAEDAERFDLATFVTRLATMHITMNGRRDVVVRTTLLPVTIRASDAQPMGLIINELITNAMKHAFNERIGRLELSVGPTGPDPGIAVLVEDDGDGFETTLPAKSLGMGLVKQMAKQIGATIEWTSGPTGTRARVFLPQEGS